jgi:hypothetical protein
MRPDESTASKPDQDVAVDPVRQDAYLKGLAAGRSERAAENDALRAALRKALGAARLFNRSGMTWLEYDRLLASLECWLASDETQVPE